MIQRTPILDFFTHLILIVGALTVFQFRFVEKKVHY